MNKYRILWYSARGLEDYMELDDITSSSEADHVFELYMEDCYNPIQRYDDWIFELYENDKLLRRVSPFAA